MAGILLRLLPEPIQLVEISDESSVKLLASHLLSRGPDESAHTSKVPCVCSLRARVMPACANTVRAGVDSFIDSDGVGQEDRGADWLDSCEGRYNRQ